MKRDTRWSRTSFWLGMACAWGVLMAVQDWMGLERWQQYEASRWIDLPWWVGALVATVAFLGQPLNEAMHERS